MIRSASFVLVVSAILSGACTVESPAKTDPAKEPVAAKTDPAQPEPTKVAAADAAKDEHAGCIYAGTEKEKDPACPHGGEGEEPQGPATGEGHFGAPFQLADAVPLGKAIEKGPAEAPVKVSGTVEAVCQKKGCWMVVKDGTESARVLMKDHGFAVPMDSRGKSVVVEGTLSSREFDEAQVKHLEADRGGDPSKVSGSRKEHVLTASGIEIRAQS
jgi:hypothetical protein